MSDQTGTLQITEFISMGKLRPREEETCFLDYNPKSPEGTLKISSSPTDALQQVSPQASSRSAQDGTIRPTLIARQMAGTGRCRDVGTKRINPT